MLTIKLLLADMQLQYGIDESYKLSIPATGNPIYAHLEVCKAVLAFFCFTNLYTRKHVLLFHQANACHGYLFKSSQNCCKIKNFKVELKW